MDKIFYKVLNVLVEITLVPHKYLVSAVGENMNLLNINAKDLNLIGNNIEKGGIDYSFLVNEGDILEGVVSDNNKVSINVNGNEIKVGVIDSGCYLHPDLEQNVLSGRNYTSEDVTDTTDNIGHGTYVSGIIAAECNDLYITGIAHQAKIVPLKCFDPSHNPTKD